MNIEIRDSALEARIKKQLRVTGEEVLLRLLETQEEQDRWLSETVKPSMQRFDAASNSSTAAREYPKTTLMLT